MVSLSPYRICVTASSVLTGLPQEAALLVPLSEGHAQHGADHRTSQPEFPRRVVRLKEQRSTDMQRNRRASRACTCQRSLFVPFVHRFTTGPMCAACRSRASHCLPFAPPFAPLATRLLRCLRTRADDTAEKRRAVLEMAAGLINGQRAFRSARRCSYATTSSGFTGFSPGARMARTTTSSSRTTKSVRYIHFRRVPKRRCRNSSENDGFSYAKPQERGKSRR